MMIIVCFMFPVESVFSWIFEGCLPASPRQDEGAALLCGTQEGTCCYLELLAWWGPLHITLLLLHSGAVLSIASGALLLHLHGQPEHGRRTPLLMSCSSTPTWPASRKSKSSQEGTLQAPARGQNVMSQTPPSSSVIQPLTFFPFFSHQKKNPSKKHFQQGT